MTTAAPPDDDGQRTLPLFEERATVGVRAIERARVRVTTRVLVREDVIARALTRDTVEVVRVPMEREIDVMPAVREDADGTIVVPVVEERLVVETRLVLREEVHLRRRRETETVAVPVSLRREEAEVERLPAGSDATAGPSGGTADKP
jgi:stress response protein YsnF